MKIALSGGTGFIGSHFLEQALNGGHEVIAIRRSPSSRPRIALTQSPTWINRTLDQVSSDDLSGCDVLVHLATHTGNVPYDTLANCLYWNVTASLDLFENARLAGIRRFVIAGSCFEYGKSGERFKYIPTDAPLEPTNSYATSKAAASIVFSQWAQQHHISLDILRIFHVYGEGELASRFWPSMRAAAFEGIDFRMSRGEQVRDFMYVKDVASLFLRRSISSDLLSPSARVFNLSSGNPMSICSFAELFWDKWNAKGKLIIGSIPYRKGEVMSYMPGDNRLLVSNASCL